MKAGWRREAAWPTGMHLVASGAPPSRDGGEAAPLRPKGRLNLLGFISTAGGKIITQTGRVTKEVFKDWVIRHLVPFLKQGDIVLWDNARIHDSEDAKAAIRAVGAD